MAKRKNPQQIQDVGERINFLAERHSGGRLAWFARDTGITRSVLYKYVKGERMPDGESLAKIAEFTGVDLNWLVTGKGAAPGELLEKPHGYTSKAAEGIGLIPRVDQDLLRDVLLAIDLEMEAQGITVKPEKKAEVAAILYEMFAANDGEQSVDKKRIAQLLKLAS